MPTHPITRTWPKDWSWTIKIQAASKLSGCLVLRQIARFLPAAVHWFFRDQKDFNRSGT